MPGDGDCLTTGQKAAGQKAAGQKAAGPGRRRPGTDGRRPAPVAAAVVQFSVAGLAALALVVGGAVFVLQRTGTREAVRDARQLTGVIGHGIVEPNLTSSLMAGEAAAVGRMDDIVHRLLAPVGVVRVKLWTGGGRIVYSDEHRLVGSVFALGPEEQVVLRSGGEVADLSDLSAPENRYEPPGAKLLEVYVQVRGPGGSPMLFEAYLPFRSVAAGGQRIWRQFAPVALGALALLELIQVPLAWSVGRRLRDSQREREELLQRAIDASDAERRRIARDLHDGVVQDLVGVSYTLAAAAEGAEGAAAPANGSGRNDHADRLLQAASATRDSIRQLRTLLIDIYPPDLHTAGLEVALSDLLAAFPARGVRAHLECCSGLELPPAMEALLFRTTQEALRNVLTHAEAASVRVSVTHQDNAVTLEVEDDGGGFSPGAAERPAAGHMGLRVLADLAADAGGALEVESEPGRGTRLRLVVPV